MECHPHVLDETREGRELGAQEHSPHGADHFVDVRTQLLRVFRSRELVSLPQGLCPRLLCPVAWDGHDLRTFYPALNLQFECSQLQGEQKIA